MRGINVMEDIKNINGQPAIDYMARDAQSFLQSMQSLIPEKLPEWKESQSQADFGNVLLQLFAHMGDILSYYQDRIANESFLGTAQSRRSIIHHLRLISYHLATASPASTELTLLVPITSNETITISKGDAFATKSQKDKPSVRFEYTQEEPLVILSSDFALYDKDPNLQAYSPIPVEEGRLIRDEIIGTSDGTPNQVFQLGHPKMILRSLDIGQTVNADIVLITELEGNPEQWVLQESLAFSRADQRDFVIDIDEDDQATIRFGDGTFGAIPTGGSVVHATYRVGGGPQGNVVANSIETIVEAPQLSLLGAKVTNENATAGGAERESISHAVAHAPEVFRSFKRAVTEEDYKALALKFSGVGKVRAVGTNWNTVTLFVAPKGGGHVSDILEANLLAYFEDKRALSTKIEIEDVDYVRIYVTAKIGVEPYYSEHALMEQVKQKVVEKLLKFEKVDFGETIYLSKFFEVIEDIPGIAFVTIPEFRREGEAPPENSGITLGKLLFKKHELPTIPNQLDDEVNGDAQYADGLKVLIDRSPT